LSTSREGDRIIMASSNIRIQTSAQSVPSIPPWLGEVTIVAHSLTHLGLLEKIGERVRFARARFGIYDTIDFVVVLIGYSLSGEPTLKTFYEHLLPFATPFMALFGRDQLPDRSTLSRFLKAINQPTVEALRLLFEEDLLSRPLTLEGEQRAGLRDRCGELWKVFDVDGTRQAARQRALPHTKDLPMAYRRFDAACAPGYLGRKRGEGVRTRTTILLAHTHQWFGTFGGPGNGDYRRELLRAIQVITSSAVKQKIPPDRLLLRLDGQYGDFAVVIDVARSGLCYVIRGKDYALLDLPQIQARLAQPPDQVTTHPETGTCRALFDCPDIPLTGTALTMRVIVATHPATSASAPVGVTRDDVIYELFFTALPQAAFTPADVVDLYLHRGAFETVLSDEDKEQDPDRWVSRTACGQEFWQILSQWMWNLRLELGHRLHPTPMRTTTFAGADALPLPPPVPDHTPSVVYGPPEWARTARVGIFAGTDFTAQLDGTLRCPAGHPLYAQERRTEKDGTVRVIYAARIADCRACPLREQCQGHGKDTKHPRRVSAVLRPIGTGPSFAVSPPQPKAEHPILWSDWSRCQTRRVFVSLLRTQTVTLAVTPAASSPEAAPDPFPLTRQQRAHWRISWAQRLERNAAKPSHPYMQIHLFGIPTAFATSIGLAAA
jgi:hypothetical protein